MKKTIEGLLPFSNEIENGLCKLPKENGKETPVPRYADPPAPVPCLANLRSRPEGIDALQKNERKGSSRQTCWLSSELLGGTNSA
jgi:hypothetical protein